MYAEYYPDGKHVRRILFMALNHRQDWTSVENGAIVKRVRLVPSTAALASAPPQGEAVCLIEDESGRVGGCGRAIAADETTRVSDAMRALLASHTSDGKTPEAMTEQEFYERRGMEAMEQAVTAALASAPPQGEACDWMQDSDGFWRTDCGNTFEFNAGDPFENGAKFCLYCGNKLVAVPYEEPMADDDDDNAFPAALAPTPEAGT